MSHAILARSLVVACALVVGGAALEGCVVQPVRPVAAEWRRIAGWDAWLCREDPDGRSSWWRAVDSRADAARPFPGTCDSWALADPGVAVGDAPVGGAYHRVRGWPQWMCADLIGSPARSSWYEDSRGSGSAEAWLGSCESWQK